MKLRDCIKMVGAALLLAMVTWGAIIIASAPTPPPVVVKTEYYARIAAIYEGNVDWRFYVTSKILEQMAPQFIGKPMLLGHNWANPDMCVGRVVDAAVKQDRFGKYVEVIVKINSDEAAEFLKRNRYHSVSIGFETLKEICLIDGTEDCSHQAGHRYKVGDKYHVARKVLVEVRIHEVSFVNVPASPNARVLELADHRIRCSDSK